MDDDIENVIGDYTCSVTNEFGNSSSELTVRGRMIINMLYTSASSIEDSRFQFQAKKVYIPKYV